MRTFEKKISNEEIPGNEISLRRSRQRWLAALFVSSVLGIMAGIFGLIISSLNLLGGMRGEGSGRLGTWLIAVAFPLVLFSAHCLHRVNKTDAAIRDGHDLEQV